MIVNVSDALPPVADTGPEQTVPEGTLVTLSGTNSSDPGGVIVSFLWTQTLGPPSPCPMRPWPNPPLPPPW